MALVRVLIVDDVPHVRQDLSAFLALAGGVQVIGEAGDGQEAVRQVELLRPEVVLLDLEMSVLDGYAATRQIKARCPHCRVIVYTVHSYTEACEKAIAAGVDEFVVKGASLDTLLRVILRR